MIVHVVGRRNGEPLPTGLCGKQIGCHSMYISDSRSTAIQAYLICPECRAVESKSPRNVDGTLGGVPANGGSTQGEL